MVCGGSPGDHGIPYSNLRSPGSSGSQLSLMANILNLFVIMAVGVIIADLVANGPGTNTLLCGIASLWGIGVAGMMGNPPPTYNCGAATPAKKPKAV